MGNPIGFLRITGLVEGLSFIILLFIAMPLKYVWGNPLAVKIVGMVHGILFVLFCFALMRAMYAARWSLGRGAFVFAAAFLPFGPFLIDKKMKAWEREFLSSELAS